MSTDHSATIGIVVVCLGLLALTGYGCETMHRTQQVRANAPTVITCVEHSVLDRVHVQQ